MNNDSNIDFDHTAVRGVVVLIDCAQCAGSGIQPPDVAQHLSASMLNKGFPDYARQFAAATSCSLCGGSKTQTARMPLEDFLRLMKREGLATDEDVDEVKAELRSIGEPER